MTSEPTSLKEDLQARLDARQKAKRGWWQRLLGDDGSDDVIDMRLRILIAQIDFLPQYRKMCEEQIRFERELEKILYPLENLKTGGAK